jgi:hypothetical protein
MRGAATGGGSRSAHGAAAAARGGGGAAARGRQPGGPAAGRPAGGAGPALARSCGDGVDVMRPRGGGVAPRALLATTPVSRARSASANNHRRRRREARAAAEFRTLPAAIYNYKSIRIFLSPLPPTYTAQAPPSTVKRDPETGVMAIKTAPGVQILAPVSEIQATILTPAAQAFVATLHRAFGARRAELLRARAARQAQLDAGALPDFLPATAAVRADPSWRGAPPAPGLADRRVEITGPVDRKMVINALNSGATQYMADFEGGRRRQRGPGAESPPPSAGRGRG